jgi:hypothetical protein
MLPDPVRKDREKGPGPRLALRPARRHWSRTHAWGLVLAALEKLPGPRLMLPPPIARRRWPRTLAWSLAFAVVVLVLAWLAMNGKASQERLREEVARALEARVPGARLEGGARIDWSFRLVAGPITIPGRPGAPPVMRLERAVVLPRLSALFAARLEPAVVWLQGLQVDAGPRGEALTEFLERLRSGKATGPGRTAAAAPAPELRFEDMTVRVALAAEPGATAVELEPLSGRVRLERTGPATIVKAEFATVSGARGDVRVSVWNGAGAFVAHFDHVEPSSIPASLRAMLPVSVEGGALSLTLDAPALNGVTQGEARFEATVTGLTLRSEELASGPVGPLALRLTGALRWDAAARRLALGPARLDLGPTGRAGAEVTLELETRPEPRFELAIRAKELDWKAALDALPQPLRPPPEAPQVKGELALRLTVSGRTRHPSAWRIEGDVDPSGLAPAPGGRALGMPFTWQAPLLDGRTRPVVIGPANRDFVPLASLPGYVVRSVLASEDAGFYAHHGFDLQEIQDALSRAGERPRMRGASTITQQLAKNLYLSPERTLLRKVREAMATVALESSVSKRRLLEIYLNLAEWGPGVHGIGQAARHWFGKNAQALSPKEAAFLASVIPNPVRYEMYRQRGALTELWEERVRDLLVKLRSVGALTDEQFQEAWNARLEFAQG